MLDWWASRTECLSGLHRRARAGDLNIERLAIAKQRLSLFERAAATVLPTESVRIRADRLLRVHPLRAADAFQLAAALLAARRIPKIFPSSPSTNGWPTRRGKKVPDHPGLRSLPRPLTRRP